MTMDIQALAKLANTLGGASAAPGAAFGERMMLAMFQAIQIDCTCVVCATLRGTVAQLQAQLQANVDGAPGGDAPAAGT